MSTQIVRISGELPKAAKLALSAIAAVAMTAQAVEFENDVIEGNFDTTLSYGGSFRTTGPDPGNIGRANGGERYSVNGDDANLNYGTGLFSHVAKGTHDLELEFKKLQDVSLFLRGTYFIDFENIRGDSPLSDEAKRDVGRDMELLDAYISYDLPTATPVNIRLGNQVLNWGESTFIQNGINVINPIDVTKFRIPGSELREALRPVPLLSVALEVTGNLTLEGFYQFKQEEMEIDASGSYFSTKDTVGPGGRYAMIGFGSFGQPDMNTFIDNPLLDPKLEPFFEGEFDDQPTKVPMIHRLTGDLLPVGVAGIPRGHNREASDSGQFGIAARYFAEALNETEFGFYFINYHSRLPYFGAITGRNIAGKFLPAIKQAEAGIDQVEARINQVDGDIAQLEANDPTSDKLPDLKAEQTGLNTQHAALTGKLSQLDGLRNQLTNLYPGTARYFLEYPEDIQLYGVSFNTEIGATGISLQGEVSYRNDMPLQIDDVELLIAGLTPYLPVSSMTQLGQQDFNSYIQGYRRFDVWQPQVTATKLFGPTLGANQWVLVGEVGATVVPNLPEKDLLRFDGPGTALSGNRQAPGLPGHAPYSEPASAFADDFSWGYRLAARIDYTDVFGGVNLSPAIAFAHDVDGNTPLPIGNFLQDRKSVTVGVTATYQNSWQAAVKYTEFFGNETYNLMNDRDFLSAMVQYSF